MAFPIGLEEDSPDVDVISGDVSPEGVSPEDINEEELNSKKDEEERIIQEDEECDRLLKILINEAEKEDEDSPRYRLLQICKRNVLYFNNFQNIFFDEVARDYKAIDAISTELANVGSIDDTKIINIYRAFAESLIAAMSVATPNIAFTPDDAENPDDIESAEAYSKISDLVQRHNAAGLMFIKSLTIWYNQGVVFAYNYYKSDPSYGFFETPVTNTVESKTNSVYCPECGELQDSGITEKDLPNFDMINCQNCKYSGHPDVLASLTYNEEVVSYEKTPKGRVGFDVFGPCHVKAPMYARKQEDLGYLILRLDDHYAKFKTVYSNHPDSEMIQGSGADTTKYERWSRVPPEYYGATSTDITTCRYAFFRPWYYNKLRKEDAALLFEKYPNGVKVDIIDDIIYDKQNVKLDDVWTVTFNPTSEFIHAEPPGNSIIPIQDAENDMFNLGLMSIEYGIPETFANPKTLNLKQYSKQRSTPGMMSPALPPGPDRNLADGFHTIKAATLSNEYTTFERGVQEKGQFVSGAVPSLWGGTNSAGSNTATEYTESRARAMQRLQLPWKSMGHFWSSLQFKCAKLFAENLREDEHYTDKKNGTYVNVWIRKSSLQGKVGQIEPVANEQLPQSWMQKRDFFMRLIEMQNPDIGTLLLHPNNSELLKQISGIPDFYVPGEHDRNKQHAEFYILSTQEPINEVTPSVPVDADVDDHKAQMQVLKNILVSPVGISLYQTSPAFYQNCILHYKQHEMADVAKTMAMRASLGSTPDSSTKTTEG